MNDETIDLLKELGFSQNMATVLLYLSDKSKVTSREIEKDSNLRQPEVSVVLRTMKDKGWVEEAPGEKDGRGRPTKVYYLKISLRDIMREIEVAKDTEYSRTMKTIERVKLLLSV
ncbi:MAG: MarR family transcriptional regulator [Acidobacteria bacterium]|nr:MarR family transcriptional regulator [Acidobacteriota bacterium]